jgi:hypothetical protein
MIDNYLSQLYSELGLGSLPPFEKDGSLQVSINSFSIEVMKLDTGAHLSALVAPTPTKEREEFLLKLMKANFLGQGTGGGVLGMKEDESFLTLSLSLPYEMNYRAFKDAVEEFVNFLDYWKTETARHEMDSKADAKMDIGKLK